MTGLDFEFWHWLAFAALLLGIEVLVPSTFLLGPAAAAALVGVLVLLLPDLPLGWQALIFAFGSLGLTWVIRRYVKQTARPSDQPGLNRRASSLIGRRATVVNRLTNGAGSLTFDDTTWRVRTEDGRTAEPGWVMEVIGDDGAILVVKRAE